MRWDLIDKFEVLKKGALSRAYRDFTGREDFFEDHFPGQPVVPQSLLIEMVAQAGGVLFGLEIQFCKEVILAKIERAHFPHFMVPPCRLSVEAVFEDANEDGARIKGVVKQGDRVAAEVELFLVAMDSLEGLPKKNIVFNDYFLSHYDILNVVKQSEELV